MHQEDEENTCSKQIKSISCSCVLADIRDIDRLYMWIQSLQRKFPMKHVDMEKSPFVCRHGHVKGLWMFMFTSFCLNKAAVLEG